MKIMTDDSPPQGNSHYSARREKDDNEVVGLDDVESPPSKCPMRSMGRGKMTVEFFSAEIELSV